MNLLVYAAHAIAGTTRAIPDWRIAETHGHRVAFAPDDLEGLPDAIVCMSISRMREAEVAVNHWPDVPSYFFHWDAYSWVWTQPRAGEYGYDRWGRLLLRAKEVWVPSHCTGLQAAQWWDLDRWLTIKSSVPWWDPTPGRTAYSGDYLLCTLRRIPDPWCDVFDECCTELGIPFHRPDHQLSWDDYRAEVAGCRALVSHYEELSTGGLTLLEGYRLGKPVLLNDSRWHGGRDYFGSRAGYFKKGDRQDFAACLKSIWEGNGLMEPDHRQWVEENYSDRLMVERMLARIEYHEGQ